MNIGDKVRVEGHYSTESPYPLLVGEVICLSRTDEFCIVRFEDDVKQSTGWIPWAKTKLVKGGN